MIDPCQFAEQMAGLKEWADNEAAYRTIIGRWYYAAYHHVKTWLEQRFANELADTDGHSHEKITLCCNTLQRKHMDLEFSKLGRLLSNLKTERVKADYLLDLSFQPFDVPRIRLIYKDIIRQLTHLKNKYPPNN